jgi:hypothetical protein
LRGGHGDAHLFEVAGRAQRLEDLRRILIVAIGGGLRAGLGGEARERELAYGSLVALADELEDARALRDVVIRLGGAGQARAQLAAQAQELAPCPGRRARVEPRLHLGQPPFGLVYALGRKQRLSGDQLRLDGFRRRRIGGFGDLVGDGEGFVGLSAPRRQPGADHAQRPFVPPARVAPVGAVGFRRLAQVLGRVFVVAAHQRHLRQRVVNGTGRLVELHGAADVQRAVQHGVGAIEVADAHADLAQGGECHRKAGALPEAFVQVDRAIGERERLLVAVPDQRDVGLVPVHGREHIVGLQQGRHPLGLPQRGIGLVVAPGLGQHDGRERMDHGEVPLVARGVQRGGRLRDVLTDNRHVADLAVALTEIEVGQADGARVVGDLGLLERAVVQRDRPRLFAACKRHSTVQTPQI